MTAMRRAPVLLVLLAVAAMLAVGTPAFAHTSVMPAPVVHAVATLHEIITAAPAEPSLPWTALGLMAAVTLATLSRQRRVTAVALVLVAGLLVFETGVHSAHHLGKADEAAQCTVAWTSSQVSADAAPAAADTTPVVLVEASTPVLAVPSLPARVLAPDAGRAPPAPSV
jgi:hypothetical protein